MTQADDERFLRKGWDWLEGHADHDPLPENYHALEEAWLKRLRQYEEAYRLVHEPIAPGRRLQRLGQAGQRAASRSLPEAPRTGGSVQQTSF